MMLHDRTEDVFVQEMSISLFIRVFCIYRLQRIFLYADTEADWPFIDLLHSYCVAFR